MGQYIRYRPGIGFAIIDGTEWDGVRFGNGADDELRETLSIATGLTDDEAEVAMIERELEQAVADSILTFWNFHRYTDGTPQEYELWLGVDRTHRSETGDTRLRAARAAVARVAELRAEAKRLHPDEMSAEECYWELTKRGWKVVLLRDIRAWVTPCNKYEYDQKDTETTEAHNRRMVAVARELDAQK